MLSPPSRLERPPANELRSYKAPRRADTIRVFLEKGWSLAICCRDCRRAPVEWTPPELERKFGSALGVPVADLIPRLRCLGDEGCGSKDVVVYPHHYDGEWRWPRALNV